MFEKPNTPLYIFLAVVAAGTLIWLHWWVIPDLVLATVDPSGKLQTGYVFGHISKKLTLDDYIMLKSSARGWAGISAWWPLGLAATVIGSVVGWFVGRFLLSDEHAAAAGEVMRRAEAAGQEADRRAMAASQSERKATQANRAADHHAAEADRRAAAQVAAANQRAGAAEERAADAERKLAAERDRHEADLKAARSRIAILKKKGRGDDSTDD